MSTNTLRTIPELLGKTRSSLRTPLLYTPDKIPVEADVEMQALEEIKSSEVMRLDDVMARMKSRPRTLDVDTVLHIRVFGSTEATNPMVFHRYNCILQCHPPSSLMFFLTSPYI